VKINALSKDALKVAAGTFPQKSNEAASLTNKLFGI
jgi:hypothetical protein